MFRPMVHELIQLVDRNDKAIIKYVYGLEDFSLTWGLSGREVMSPQKADFMPVLGEIESRS
jgi:hypothetical protein